MAGCLLGGSDVHRTHNECVLCVFVSLPFESLKLTPQEWDRGAEEDRVFLCTQPSRRFALGAAVASASLAARWGPLI